MCGYKASRRVVWRAFPSPPNVPTCLFSIKLLEFNPINFKNKIKKCIIIFRLRLIVTHSQPTIFHPFQRTFFMNQSFNSYWEKCENLIGKQTFYFYYKVPTHINKLMPFHLTTIFNKRILGLENQP